MVFAVFAVGGEPIKGVSVIIRAVVQERDDIFPRRSGASKNAIDVEVDFVDFVHLVGPRRLFDNVMIDYTIAYYIYLQNAGNRL